MVQCEADQGASLFTQLVWMILEILLNDDAHVPHREAVWRTIIGIASNHQCLEGYPVRESPHVGGAGKLTVSALAKAKIGQFNSRE